MYTHKTHSKEGLGFRLSILGLRAQDSGSKPFRVYLLGAEGGTLHTKPGSGGHQYRPPIYTESVSEEPPKGYH